MPLTSTSMNAAHLVLHPELLRSSAAQAVGVLKILANEDRLMLLCQLSQGEHCVSELEQELGDRKSTRLNSSHRNTSRMPSSA